MRIALSLRREIFNYSNNAIISEKSVMRNNSSSIAKLNKAIKFINVFIMVFNEFTFPKL
jgi:hypothetical protein